MAQLQHWTVTCTTCDDPAEHHCNTCGDILCPRCKQIHERSRATGHHSIVPYSERLEPRKLTLQCEDHPGETCTLWCHRCDKAACTDCVTSAEHLGHEFLKIASKLEEQRNAIREEFEHYTKLLNTWEDSLQQVKSSGDAFNQDIDGLDRKISMAADRVCEQVRSIETALHKELQEIKASQANLLQGQANYLQKEIENIEQKLKEAEDKLRSEDITVQLYYRADKDKSEIVKPTKKDDPELPVFSPGEINTQTLEVMVGNLSMKKNGQASESEVNESSERKSPTHQEGETDYSYTLPQTGPFGSSTTRLSLLSEAINVNTIQADTYSTPYLACTQSGQAWVRSGEYRLNLIDLDGTVTKTLNTGFYVGSMTLSSQETILINDVNDHSIKYVSENGDFQTLFKTKWTPCGLCCLDNGDVMVTFANDGRVTQYNFIGKVVRELDKSFFTHPTCVAQGKVDRDIYVIDKTDKDHTSYGRLLVFDFLNVGVKYVYTGSCTPLTMFTPCHVCTDVDGHVIITDYDNHKIHILGLKGNFLQYMMTKDQGLRWPFSVALDSYGHVWVSEWKAVERSQVKILKYMS